MQLRWTEISVESTWQALQRESHRDYSEFDTPDIPQPDKEVYSTLDFRGAGGSTDSNCPKYQK